MIFQTACAAPSPTTSLHSSDDPLPGFGSVGGGGASGSGRKERAMLLGDNKGRLNLVDRSTVCGGISGTLMMAM